MERLDVTEGADTLGVGDRTLSLPGPLRDAWRDADHVYVMAATLGERAYELFVYDAETLALRHRIPPPEGWNLYRLTDHQRGPSAIASSLALVGGHQDWHFLIDPEAGTLTRTVPSR